MLGPLQRGFSTRFARTAADNLQVAKATYAVTALSAPPAEMMTPALMWAVMRGPRNAPLTAEQAIAQYPEFGDLLSAGALQARDGRQ